MSSSNASRSVAWAARETSMAAAIPARIRPHLAAVAAVLALATSAGFAVAHGQQSKVFLAYAGLMVFVLPVVAGRSDLVLALVLALSIVAIGPFSNAGGGGGLHTSSMRLPLLLAASGAVLLAFRGPRLPRGAVFFYSALLMCLIVGLPFSPDPSGGAQYLLKLCVPLAVAAAIATLGSYGVAFAELLGLAALGATLVVDYVMVLLGAGYYGEEGEPARFGGLAASGPSTGFVLSLLGVFALVVWLSNGRLLALVLWAASFPLLLVTLTRSGIAAWLVGSMAALLIAKRLKLAFLFTVVAVAVLAGNSTLADRSLPEQSGGWGAVIASVEKHGFSGISTTGRSNLWDEMLRRFSDHPLAGNGLGAAAYYAKSITSGAIEQAHSEYLTLLVDGGLVALCLWIVTWAVLARSVWLGAGRLAVSCIVAYAVLAAVDSPISDYAQGGAMIGIALGWALARNAPEFNADDEPGAISPPRSPTDLRDPAVRRRWSV
jgi:O-antigen ligase